MRIIAALFFMVLAAVILFVVTDLIINLAFVIGQYPWAGWPRSAQGMTQNDVHGLVVQNQVIVAFTSLVMAAIGGLLFGISHVNDGCNAALLGARRWITFACLVGIALPVLFGGTLEITCRIIGAYVGYETGAAADVRQIRTPDALRGVVAQNVLSTIDQYRLEILLGCGLFALVVSCWICNVIAFSDWLPWCNGWVARAKRQAATQTGRYRGTV